jgi:hypothetical protein
MSDNQCKLPVTLLEETNYLTWCPAMEAHLRVLGVVRIVIGERTELEVLDYAGATPQFGWCRLPVHLMLCVGYT